MPFLLLLLLWKEIVVRLSWGPVPFAAFASHCPSRQSSHHSSIGREGFDQERVDLQTQAAEFVGSKVLLDEGSDQERLQLQPILHVGVGALGMQMFD